ncbi:hypothetical protein Tco_1476480 [Tanacetum coccineum]
MWPQKKGEGTHHSGGGANVGVLPREFCSPVLFDYVMNAIYANSVACADAHFPCSGILFPSLGHWHLGSSGASCVLGNIFLSLGHWRLDSSGAGKHYRDKNRDKYCNTAPSWSVHLPLLLSMPLSYLGEIHVEFIATSSSFSFIPYHHSFSGVRWARVPGISEPGMRESGGDAGSCGSDRMTVKGGWASVLELFQVFRWIIILVVGWLDVTSRETAVGLVFFSLFQIQIADVNVNAPAEQAPAMAPPTRTADQIMPRIRWVPIGKSNCYLDVERSQSNPIYKIAVDILKHANFFRAFTASLTIPSIYIQQFWDTVLYDNKTGSYSCQQDEQWFDLTKDTLRHALQITLVDTNNAFSSPPTPDALIKFVNDLGYPRVVRTLSDVMTNDMFQPWRALTTVINLCLMGKTLGFERPRAPVLQIIWGIVNQAHINYAERMWEEFTQSIHTFIEDKKNLAQHTQGKKKATLIVISNVRFTKLIIYYLQSKHKFYPRPGSLLHFSNEEHVLGYLKFSAKGTKREVFGMPILNDLITNDIRGEQYYNAYLEKVAKHQRYLAGEEVSDPDSPAPKPELGLTDSESESDEEVPGIDAGVQDKGQAGPNPGEQDEGQAGLNPDDAAPSQPSLSHVVLVGPDLEHMNLEASDTLIQPNPEQMDEEFTTTAYPNVQENLKLPTEGEVRLEEPASSAGTLSSLQNLDKELSFTNKFLAEKSQEDEPEKTNIEAEVQSMVTVPIHQDTSSVPLMTTPAIDLTVSQPVPTAVQAPLPTLTATATATTTTTTTLPLPPQPQQGSSDSILIQRIGELEQHMADLVQANLALEERMDKHGSRLYKLENLNIPHQVSKAVDEIVTDAVDWAIQAPLRDRFRDLPEADMKEILHHRMWESNSYQAHEDHKMLYEALEKSMARDHTDQLLTDLAEARRKKKKRHASPKTPPGSPPHQPPPPPPPAGSSGTPGASGASGSSQLPPPPPPPSTNQSDQSTSTAAPSSSKTAASAKYTAWTTTDTRLKPSVSSIPKELHTNDDTTPNE